VLAMPFVGAERDVGHRPVGNDRTQFVGS
jgi:hypothetical protein